MLLKKEVIENVFSIHFEDISKYLKYDDYYKFYQLYSLKNIEKLKRKCLYCKQIPICPVNINYMQFYEKCFIDYRDIKLICEKSLTDPICYICCMENWIMNFNKLKLRTRLETGFVCPYKCCKVKINEYKYGLGKYKENLINFDINWKNFKKINYHKCKYCNMVFRNKTHNDIFRHYKYSTCRIIIKKLQDGQNMNLHIYSNTYSDSDSSSESDLEEEFL